MFGKSNLLSNLNNEINNIHLSDTNKASQCILLLFGDFHFLDTTILFGWETSWTHSWKLSKLSRPKVFLYKRFDHPNKLQKRELPLHEVFYLKICSCNRFVAENSCYVNLSKYQLLLDQPFTKLKLSKPPPTTSENKKDYRSKNKPGHLKTFCVGIKIKVLFHFWKQCIKCGVISKKIIIFWKLIVTYQTKLKIVLKKMQAQFYLPSREKIEGCWTLSRKNWLSIIWSHKGVLDETFFQISTYIFNFFCDWCRSTVFLHPCKEPGLYRC